MTLVVGIIAKTGVAIAGDRRQTTGGQYSATASNDTVQKIFKITDRCGMGISGSGEIGVTLVESFIQDKSKEYERAEPSVLKISDDFRQYAKNKYIEWYQGPFYEKGKEDYLHIFLAGYKKNGRFSDPKIIRMFSPNFEPRTSTTGFTSIGVPTFANYILNRIYLKNKFKLQEVVDMAVFCILETASQDGSVGEEVQIASFSTKQNFKFYNQSKVDEVKSRARGYRINLQKLFLLKRQQKENPKTHGPKRPTQTARKAT